MEKVLVDERLYCQKCYHERRQKLIEAHTLVGTHVVTGARKVGLSEAEVACIQTELQKKLRDALHNLNQQCLGNSQQR